MAPKWELHARLAHERTWAYLATVLHSLPFRSSPLKLRLLTLSIRFSKTTTQVEARKYLDVVHPRIAVVEHMLLEWVERRVLREVRVDLVQPLEDATIMDIQGWMVEYLPRLHDAGVLVLAN